MVVDRIPGKGRPFLRVVPGPCTGCNTLASVEHTPPGRRSARPVIVAGAVVLVIATVCAVLRFFVNTGGVVYHIDFDVYRAGGRAVLDSIPLYEGSFAVGGITLPFTYPPLSALAFVPTAVLPTDVGAVLFNLVSLAALAATVAVVLQAAAREAGRTLSRRTLWAVSCAVVPLAVWLWPVNSTLGYGQINVVLMLLVVADLLLPRTPWPRGMLIGLAAALKLTPAVFGLMFLLRRQWREAATSVVSGVAFSALAWLILPGDSHRYWTETISDPTRIGGLAYSANQSWRGVAARFTDGPGQEHLWLVLAVVTAVAVIVVMLRQLAVGAVAAAVCTNSLLGLLASPVSWAHHWVWVLPMLVILGAAWWWGRRPGALALFTVILLLSTVLVFHVWYPSKDNVELDWSLIMKVTGAEFVVLGVIWLVAGAVAPALARAGSSQRR